MQAVLATDSENIYVRHDNAGQNAPVNNSDIESRITPTGLDIDIRANADIKQPIILFTSCAQHNTSVNNINIGENAKVEILEYLVSDQEDAINTVTTNINCGQGAQLKHCIFQHATDNLPIQQNSTTVIRQEQHSKVNSNIFAFGGTENKIKLSIALQGVEAICNASYLSYTNTNEAQNVLLEIEHIAPHCTSNSIARSVLKDKSLTDFVGKIIVHPNAIKSQADLQIKNLLCSTKATASNKPELEIYNDDVRCSHGSSTGQINEEALFYMQQRGIDKNDAIAMIINGFIQPAIETCSMPNICQFVHKVIQERS